MRNASPSLAFAALGQARASGLITPEEESRKLGELITYWALKSTLDTGAARATPPVATTRLEASRVVAGRGSLTSSRR
jgi:hypothetical protein